MARLTRRHFAAFLAAAPALAQTAPATANQQPPAPRTIDEANKDVSDASEELKALSVPIDLEPAFAFKA
ncbi:MAG: hypothetical protein WAM39_06985 [Bryobacteraceae bacterium]